MQCTGLTSHRGHRWSWAVRSTACADELVVATVAIREDSSIDVQRVLLVGAADVVPEQERDGVTLNNLKAGQTADVGDTGVLPALLFVDAR